MIDLIIGKAHVVRCIGRTGVVSKELVVVIFECIMHRLLGRLIQRIPEEKVMPGVVARLIPEIGDSIVTMFADDFNQNGIQAS